jgi:Transposase DDE domain
VNQLSTETGAAEENSRRSAARQRAAREREARLKQALEELEQIREGKREAAKKEQARASETEPEARMMKHGDGGFAASYNLQTTTDTEHKIVLNVELTQQANDQQQLPPAVERLRQQGPETPQVIVDGGYITQDNIVAMAQAGVDLIGPQLNPEQQRQRNTQQALQRAGIAPEFSPGAFRLEENGSALQHPSASGLRASAMEPPVASTEPIQPTARTACIGRNAVLGVKRAA